MNKVILTGNLCKDNNLNYTATSIAILNQTIACKRDFKNAKGEIESDFINIVLINKQAEFIAQYAPKGSTVELIGRWQTRSYINKDNVTMYVNECVVENISILKSTKPKEEPQQNNYVPLDDFPF